MIALAACGARQAKFNKETWNDRDDFFYANRKIMVTDLMESHLREGMPYQEVIELLGKPEKYSNMEVNEIAYEIEVDYGWNIDPVSGSNLIIKLANDSTVSEFELVKWKH